MVFSLGGSNPLEKSNACLVVRGTSPLRRGSLAEWSKALVLGTSPKGRGFESHRCQSNFVNITNPEYDDCEITIQKSI